MQQQRGEGLPQRVRRRPVIDLARTTYDAEGRPIEVMLAVIAVIAVIAATWRRSPTTSRSPTEPPPGRMRIVYASEPTPGQINEDFVITGSTGQSSSTAQPRDLS